MTNQIYLIYPGSSEAGTMETLPETTGMSKIQSNHLNESSIYFSENDKVCMTSEACLELVKDRIECVQKKNAIEILKDKIKFRELIKPQFPGYQFQAISFEGIGKINLQKKIIFKTSKRMFWHWCQNIGHYQQLRAYFK